MRLWLLFGAAGALSTLAAAQPATLSRDDYWAIVWTFSDCWRDAKRADTVIARLREMNATAAMVYSTASNEHLVRNRFPYYVENMVRGLYLKGDRGWNQAWQGYAKTRDPKYFVRNPSLEDMRWRRTEAQRVRQIVRQNMAARPLMYNIRDELSVTTSANPFDFDFSPLSLASFRNWLKKQYGSLGALNAEWETNFRTWDDVRPFTTDEIKRRHRAGNFNWAPWADHRTYMDTIFWDAVNYFRQAAKEVDPTALCGVEGTQMPHAFGGYDFSKMCRAIDWIEAYDIGSAREIIRSFMPEAPVFCTLFSSDKNQISRKLWRLLLHGDQGTIVWCCGGGSQWNKDSVIDFSKPDLPLSAKGRAIAPVFRELTQSGIVKLLRSATPVLDPIAIHYSQPSIQADWMIESFVDKDTWIRRFSSYEARHNRMAKVRNSVIKAFEDLGFQTQFIAYGDVERGELLRKGFKLFIMPMSIAISAREAEEVRRFVQAGGTLLVYGDIAKMDEHCKMLPRGQLDDIVPPRMRNGKDLDVRRVGRGKVIRFGAAIEDYELLRLQPGKELPMRRLWERVAQEAGLPRPQFYVTRRDGSPPSCVEVHRWRGADRWFVATMINPQVIIRPEMEKIGGNKNLAAPQELALHLPRALHVYDVRAKKYLGVLDRVEFTLDPWSPTIFCVAEQKVMQ